MLKKLIAYEVKFTAKYMVFIWIAAAVFAAFSGFSGISTTDNVYSFYVVSTFIFVALAGAAFVAAFGVIILRFYKEMNTQEGYFTHMIPARPWEHLLARILVTAIWILITALVLALCLFLIEIPAAFAAGSSGSAYQTLLGALDGSDFYTILTTPDGSEFYAAITTGNAVSTLPFGLSVLDELVSIVYVTVACFTGILFGGIVDGKKPFTCFLLTIAIVVVVWRFQDLLNTAGETFGDSFAILFRAAVAAFLFFCCCRLLKKHVNLT